MDVTPLWEKVFRHDFDFQDYSEYEPDEKGHYP